MAVRHGFKCTVLFAQDPEEPGVINPQVLDNIPGLEALRTADLMGPEGGTAVSTVEMGAKIIEALDASL